MATPFQRRVISVVRRIPPGRVATYGDVAARAGSPRAARAVGTSSAGPATVVRKRVRVSSNGVIAVNEGGACARE